MAQSRPNRKPTFLWQALLILLPVAVLAAVGVFSLRQDKVLARHDAIEHAQDIADDLLPKIWGELTVMKDADELARQAFELDRAGRLVFPPPMAPILVPHPFDLAELNSKEASLWRRAQALDANPPGFSSAIQVFQELIDSGPPQPFAAAAHYGLGLVLAGAGKNEEAAEIFSRVLEKYPDAVGESGLPLAPLARWKLLELAGRGVTNKLVPLRSFCYDAVYAPTPLTPYFLDLLSTPATGDADEIRKWQQVWEDHELSRRLYAAAQPQFPSARFPLTIPVLGRNRREEAHSFKNEIEAPQTPVTAAWDERSVPPRFVWFSASSASRDPFSTIPRPNKFDSNWGDWHWVAIRHDDVPSGVGDNEMRTLIYKLSAPGRARTQLVTLNSDDSAISQTRARPTFSPPHRSQNYVNVDFTGPATNFADLDAPPTNHWYICRQESAIGSEITALVENTKQIPEYFGVGIKLAGKQLTRSTPDLRAWQHYYHSGKGGGEWTKQYEDPLTKASQQATNILASAIRSEHGIEQLKVDIYLTSPATLFERERARAFWFSSLIAVSAGAASMGLIGAWRAFMRQQQLSEMKSNFVSSVSHELRAPIASVRLMAESLERGKIHEPQKQHEYFRFIGQESRRLSSLIENVLDFSRIEQGRKEYEFEPTDLLALTEQTVKLMETYASERQVSLKLVPANLQPSTSNPQPNLDGRAIQQALVNLLDNAIKHSPQGAVITVGLDLPHPASSIQHPVSSIHLWVEDHGEGIPPAEHEKIFERFYRLGSELRRQTQGVGIGLSIVKHIVEAHGGRVLVRSAVGEGSRFTIELPLSAENGA